MTLPSTRLRTVAFLAAVAAGSFLAAPPADANLAANVKDGLNCIAKVLNPMTAVEWGFDNIVGDRPDPAKFDRMADASTEGLRAQCRESLENIYARAFGVEKVVAKARDVASWVKNGKAAVSARFGKEATTPNDGRMALAVSKPERRFYEKEGGVLDREPLPAPRKEVRPYRGPEIARGLAGVTVQAGGSPVTVDLSGAFRAPDGVALEFSTEFKSGQTGPISLGVTTSGSVLTITSPATMQPGPVSITVIASDSFDYVARQELSVTVAAASASARDGEPVPDPWSDEASQGGDGAWDPSASDAASYENAVSRAFGETPRGEESAQDGYAGALGALAQEEVQYKAAEKLRREAEREAALREIERKRQEVEAREQARQLAHRRKMEDMRETRRQREATTRGVINLFQQGMQIYQQIEGGGTPSMPSFGFDSGFSGMSGDCDQITRRQYELLQRIINADEHNENTVQVEADMRENEALMAASRNCQW